MSATEPEEQSSGRPWWQRPIEDLCCLNTHCSRFGESGQGNLTVRTGKGTARWRVLRCSACQREFSERKGTAMSGTTMDPERFVDVAKHLKEGCGVRATARLTGASFDGVLSVARRLGLHARALHERKARKLEVREAQFDEKWAFVQKKRSTATRSTRGSKKKGTSGIT
jgi:transposase-like protein